MLRESRIAKVNENGYRELEKSVEASELLSFRKKYATMAIDVWFLAESSDRYIRREERELVLEFIKYLFQPESLFPPAEYDEATQKNILLELVGLKDNLPPLSVVGDYLRKYHQLAPVFLFDACMIIHLDGRVLTSEQEFLRDFIRLSNIPDTQKNEILRQFKAN